MSSILSRILEAKRVRIAAGDSGPKEGAGGSSGRRFEEALSRPGPRVIAEIKHRSPSAGVILEDAAARLTDVARAYRRAGAAAISIVVEQDFFGGDPAWLPAVKSASGLPVLMKDFVVDEGQLDSAASLGADAVLLIVAALDQEALERLHAAARARGLAVLVEAHDADEVRRALSAGAAIVGLNARDLRTFTVDLRAAAVLASGLPKSVIRVAESGIVVPEDLRVLAEAGFGAFLVGESLLRAEDPARALRILRGDDPTEVKICGLTREEDVEACDEAGVDWIGLNFSERSPRRVDAARAKQLHDRVRFARGVVGVFAGNADREVRDVAERVRPQALQLTDPPRPGREPFGVPVWQTVRVGRDDPQHAVAEWPGDALVFDTAVNGVSGGTGRTFDWTLFETLDIPRPVILAGGLGPANVAEAIRRVKPRAVDVATGVESSPGVKDASRIAAFVAEVRHA